MSVLTRTDIGILTALPYLDITLTASILYGHVFM